VHAQQPAAIREATRLREAHQYAAAARALDTYLRENPGDAGTHWFQAQLQYWAGNHAAAQQSYERALALMPSDDALRIDYAQCLVATGRSTRARNVLA
jgi:predicted Zn-dependent protease